jgi:hypothetical protein
MKTNCEKINKLDVYDSFEEFGYPTLLKYTDWSRSVDPRFQVVVPLSRGTIRASFI